MTIVSMQRGASIGGMNKTEAAYFDYLHQRMLLREVIWYAFECLKFRLADNTWYIPDFTVILASGEIELHEVKGFWRDDARVKIKVAAEMYPWRFLAVKRQRQQWEFEMVGKKKL